MVKARSIGTGIGSFFNNPGVIVLGVLAVVLIFFQGDIRRAFGSLGESISSGIGGLGDINIQLPSIELPSFELPEIKLPEITLPELPSLPDIFGAGGGVTQITTPEDPDFVPLTPEQQAVLPGPVSIVQDIMGIVTRTVRGEPVSVPLIEPSIIQSRQNQLGVGGFQGLATEAPIGALSLSRIIERFMVGATEAADIRARARDDFSDFDFGTNLGLGIGSTFQMPEINTVIRNALSNVSNRQFEGLSAEEIALRLTGGNISNF